MLIFHGILMGSIPPETMVDGEPGISLGPIVVRHGEANLGGLAGLWPEAMNSWPVRLVDPLGPLGPRGYLRRCLVAPAIQAIQTTSKAVSERNNMVVVHIKSPKNTLKHLKTIPSTLKTQNQPTNSLKPTPKPSFSNMFVPFRGFPPRGLHRRGFAGDDHHCLLRRRSDDHDDRPILPLKMMDIT